MKKAELKKKIEEGSVPKLIDIREKEEYNEGEKMEGTENIPMGQMFVEAKKGNLSKDEETLLICKSGGRCEIVARELSGKGFNIDYLEGGIEEWKED